VGERAARPQRAAPLCHCANAAAAAAAADAVDAAASDADATQLYRDPYGAPMFG